MSEIDSFKINKIKYDVKDEELETSITSLDQYIEQVATLISDDGKQES